jgi:predicted secreted hydrolase
MRRRPLLLALAALPLRGMAAAAPGTLRFPADFGAHPETQIEWWYITGELAAGSAAYGFQVTFFRSRTEVAAQQQSRFAARQMIFAHAALSDVTRRRQRHDQRIARAGFGVAQASTGDTAVSLRDWQLLREGPADASRYRARVASDTAGFAFDLAFATTQPLLLQGDAGLSRKGPDPRQFSHYYSQPQLAVSGRLTLDGRAQEVSGRAWLDHEWSDSLLAPDAVGWDWIGINLDDGGALTAFRLRRADGSTVWAGGSWRDRDGRLRIFTPDEVKFTPGRAWVSPVSQTRYPVAWRIETPAGSHLLEAEFDAQELDSRASTGNFYWEGLSTLHAADGRRIGRGYLEMSGYASRLKL